MPVKWTPEADQQLLLKIIETHDLSVDTKKVSEAWPGNDPNSKPTARAITERLHKIKSLIKNSGTATPASTPKKVATPVSRNRGSAKRKNTDLTPSNKENIKSEAMVSPTGNYKRIKNEATDSDSSTDMMFSATPLRTPSKRARTAPSLPPGIIAYKDGTDDEKTYDSSASEYTMHPAKIEKSSEFVYPPKIELGDGYGGVQVHDDEGVMAPGFA
ncbi:hypothetical protein AJ79_00222 [Helicocarpus griseus UAMH5409]|uniref:Uncharacterized protein n=1 Tax=Helicocarpus griseus UAMH5409 TaxID=1447875 RepID=A0A2B7YCJ3_9EURO|nr:hypothetical protein AJ79_00222 [Helicocarpus griseus UAMH5409]